LFCLSDPCRQFKIGAPYNPESFNRTIRRLEEEGLIKKSKKDEKIHLLLTDQGRKIIKKHRAEAHGPPHSWDKKWRLVVFDIPEEKRKLRNYFRRYLVTLGFGKVQRSIWISPYDFSEIIQRYAKKLELSKYIFQITAEKFKGLSEAALVQAFWDLKGIQNKYLKLIQLYTKKQKELAELFKNSPRDKDISTQITREHLLWDYQSILSRDPHLPAEFLPDDWGGEKARIFIDSFLEKRSDR
jgi:phenylacetic acid degradation operon negative regulatory protein